MARAPKVLAYSIHKSSGQAVVKAKATGKRRSIYLGIHGSAANFDCHAPHFSTALHKRKRKKRRARLNRLPTRSF